MTDELAERDSEYGWRLKDLREQRGWTQAFVVKKLQEHGLPYMNASTLSRIESGVRPVRLSEAALMVQLYGWTLPMLTLKQVDFEAVAYVEGLHREARRQLVALRDAAIDFVEAQQRLPTAKVLLEEIAEGGVKDNELKRDLDLTLRNVTRVIETDAAKEVSDIVDAIKTQAKTPAGEIVAARSRSRRAPHGEHQAEA